MVALDIHEDISILPIRVGWLVDEGAEQRRGERRGDKERRGK